MTVGGVWQIVGRAWLTVWACVYAGAGMQPVDYLEDFQFAKGIARAYNEYRQGVGLKHRTDEEQEAIEQCAFNDAMRQRCHPAMSFQDNEYAHPLPAYCTR